MRREITEPRPLVKPGTGGCPARHYCPIKLLIRIRHSRWSRKNHALFVAGMVTDLFVPSSLTLVELVTQPAGVASAPACSKAKPAVSREGQETLTAVSERSTESIGRAGR